jgi:hypothetical protein
VLRQWVIDIVPTEEDPKAGQVTVQRLDDVVRVVWVCGATRDFMPAALRRALERFDAVSANDGAGDLWYGDADSRGETYLARLDDGNFMADQSLTDRAYRVPWAEFRDALRKAIPKPRARKAS